ncbi:hypothetical protein [Nonomuraea sp. NPDC049028]|uniref:hypothetical protein n=1 Tax=Nonomuraea sp. NPDC049028 TaxID=3364348 RepID=UPI00371504E8
MTIEKENVMSIKRRMLILAAGAAAAGTILAGSATAANAAPSHTIKTLANICVSAPVIGTTCAPLSPPPVNVLDSGRPTAVNVLQVTSGAFTGKIELKAQIDAAGVVRHQLVSARLLQNGSLVASPLSTSPTIVQPTGGPTNLAGGTISGSGGSMVFGASTEILN